jgi:hypothetical protein
MFSRLTRQFMSTRRTSLFMSPKPTFFIPCRSFSGSTTFYTLESCLKAGIKHHQKGEFAKASKLFNDVIESQYSEGITLVPDEKQTVAIALTFRARMAMIGTEQDEESAEQDLAAALKLCPGLKEAECLINLFPTLSPSTLKRP